MAFTGGSPDLRPGQPCWTGYRADVAERDDQVAVTLVTLAAPVPDLPPNLACSLIGYFRTVAVRLVRPVGERRLVDGSDGGDRLRFDRLRRPRFLPHGWKLSAERVQGSTWIRAWGPPGRPGRCGTAVAPIELIQGPAGELFPYGVLDDAGRAASRRVGRSQGRVAVDGGDRQVTVGWQDGGTGYVLRRTAACPTDPTPRPELPLRVARSVR